MTRCTLDWDNMTYSKMLKKAGLLRAMFPNNRLSIRKSSSGKGWHAVLYGVHATFEELLEMRTWLGDDPKRIGKDSTRWQKGVCCQVLFSKKAGVGEAVKYI